MLADIPATLLNRLQSVLDASARSIAGLRHSDHFAATLASFHWLHVPDRIQFKLPSLFTKLNMALLLDICPTNCGASLTCPCEVASSRIPLFCDFRTEGLSRTFLRQPCTFRKIFHIHYTARLHAVILHCNGIITRTLTQQENIPSRVFLNK